MVVFVTAGGVPEVIRAGLPGELCGVLKEELADHLRRGSHAHSVLETLYQLVVAQAGFVTDDDDLGVEDLILELDALVDRVGGDEQVVLYIRGGLWGAATVWAAYVELEAGRVGR